MSGQLTPQQLIEIYRLMFLSRRVDDREILLKRQQKIFFQVSGAGHEALQVGAALALRPGYDWFFPYYRDRALCLALGVTPEEMFLQAVGAATDPASGGRQMPTHWSSRPLHIVSTSSSTTTQVLHAVGCAEAGRYFSRHPEAAAKAAGDYRAFRDVEFHGDEVALTVLGEGSTSQGEFWEALNTASNRSCPSSSALKTTATPSACPSRSTRPAETSRGWSRTSPTSISPKSTAPMPRSACAHSRPPPRIAAPDWDPRLSMGIACAPTPTRSPTMTSSTVLPPSAKPTPCAIRSPRCRCVFCAKAFLAPTRSTRSSSNSITKSPKPPSARSQAPLPDVSSNCAPRLLRGS